MPKKILFICGSLNQTTQMHKVSMCLSTEYECFFTPYYADGIEDLCARLGLLDFTVLGGRHRRETDQYLADNNLPVDYRGSANDYDLVVTSSDLIIQKNIRKKPIVLVQEGITEPESLVFTLVKYLKLPRYLANTSTSGLSDSYEIFCVASEGYAAHFTRKGVRPEKIAITGIPNFDNITGFLDNDFSLRDYVLAVTSPLRETFRLDDRNLFINQCLAIANGRRLIFKLHPLEKVSRAEHEIKKIAPHAEVYSTGNVSHMIANAQTVITQQSTATFVAVGLGKETYTRLDLGEIRRLMPLQNGGASAAHIARLCTNILHSPTRQFAANLPKINSRPARSQS